MELSTGPSGPGGGDLGCAPTAGYVPEFTEGARSVAPAGTTGPVESQFGWHVIEVRSFGPLTTENHPEVGADVIERARASARAVISSADGRARGASTREAGDAGNDE